MQINQLLKMRRLEANWTQQELADQLYLSRQAVAKWENGEAVPSIDNLILLSDLYNVSLDELVQGSPFFKKPYVVGKGMFRISYGKIWFFWLMFFVLVPLLGFSLVISLVIIALIILITLANLPMLVDDYWVIHQQAITVERFASNPFKLALQIIRKRSDQASLTYEMIESFEIIYIIRKRFSPIDLNKDPFYLLVKTKEQGSFSLDLPADAREFLPQFAAFMERKGIPVKDPDVLLPELIQGHSLYEYMHQKEAGSH
ncbi:transcriptional regulator [Enterococcus florum]|uniref:Transcriptional regulator n=1 Tax=Enterococcus florum TaxID=2480627 RepID=A0A4P5PIA1_9ENTE|nr:helix-turn-helix transcriptional regulator [Enterococcus florum]GCF95382.1 transcriptional regulator [Enterococcus florum]